MNSLSKMNLTRGLCLFLVSIAVLLFSMNVHALMTLTKEVTGLDPNGYFVNGVTTTLTVTVTMNYDGAEGTISALGYEETLPAGFAFITGSVTGPNPPAILPPNTTGKLEFGYIFVPTFPASFSFQVSCPAAICDPVQMVGQIVYRTTGPELRSDPIATDIQLEPTIVSFTREVWGPGVGGTVNKFYIPGSQVYVTIRMEKEGPQEITALGFQDTLPNNWTYAGLNAGSNDPDVLPSEGTTDFIEFAYTNIPELPVEFTYILNVPSNYTGEAVLGGTKVVEGEPKSSAVVYRTCGGPILSPSVQEVFAGPLPCIVVSRTFNQSYYRPGENVQVTINIRINPDNPCASSVSALGYQETIPSGWVYQSVGGANPPSITPPNPSGPVLDFGYIVVPDLSGSGASFTYTIKASDTASGAQEFCGQAIYRLGGGELRSDIVCSQIVDDQPPVITILGDNPVTIECGTVYEDAGATATDIPDGDLTSQIQVTNNVDASVPGDYTVTYTVTDSSNNTVTAQRTVYVRDTQKPVIQLNGANPLIVECKSTFNDPGATVQDDCDENITVSVSGIVDVNVLGEYTLTYTAEDASGNSAEPVTRTVRVVDTAAPTITLQGANPFLFQCGGTYIDPGATATDACQGDVTVTNNASTAVNTSVPGEYTVTYTAVDSTGNTATATRTVNVVDTTPPVITLNQSSLTLECGEGIFEDPKAQSADICDNTTKILSAMKIYVKDTMEEVSLIDTTGVGEYLVLYRDNDSQGNFVEALMPVRVVDTQGPQITLEGESSVRIECGGVNQELGATAIDKCDGELSIEISGSVDPNTPGTYIITYTSTDSSGNVTTAQRTVIVEDTTPPVISLPYSEVTINCGTPFVIPDPIVSDACSIENIYTAYTIYIAATMYEVAAIDTSCNASVDEYIVRYVARDSSGNQTTANLRARIILDQPPVITILGDNPVTVECGSVYVDAGATAMDVPDGDISDRIQVTNNVNESEPGTYTVEYSVTDNLGNSVTAVRTVIVRDTIKPSIVLNGSREITVECGSTFVDPDVTVTDSCDLNPIVTKTGTVNTNSKGRYLITYTVKDASGNEDSVERTVLVVDTTRPVVTLRGDSTIVINIGQTFTDPGATALDNCDGQIDPIPVGTVDIKVPGSYVIAYIAVDSSNNIGSAERTVIVRAPELPPVVPSFGGVEELGLPQVFKYQDLLTTKERIQQYFAKFGFDVIWDLPSKQGSANNVRIKAEYECSNTVERDYFIRQNPPAGTILTSGMLITLYFSSGPCTPEARKFKVEPYPTIDFGKKTRNNVYSTKFRLINNTATLVKCYVNLQDSANGVFDLKPSETVIEVPANGSKEVVVYFKPDSIMKYEGKIRLIAYDVVSPADELYVTLKGEGVPYKCGTSCAPGEKDNRILGDLIVGMLVFTGLVVLMSRKTEKEM